MERGKFKSGAKHLDTAEFKAKKIIEGAEQQRRNILTEYTRKLKPPKLICLPKSTALLILKSRGNNVKFNLRINSMKK